MLRNQGAPIAEMLRNAIELRSLHAATISPSKTCQKANNYKDSTRKLSPLIPADDAHVIDSSNMSLEEVYIYTKNLINKEFI